MTTLTEFKKIEAKATRMEKLIGLIERAGSEIEERGSSYAALQLTLKALKVAIEIKGAMPADWEKDSSLETWFPYSAAELERLRAENERLKHEMRYGEGLYCSEETT